LQQVEFTAASARESWQWLYFVVLVSGCLGGLRLTGRTLFPEDAQILARLPLTPKRLPLIVFAEHLTTTAFNLLLFFVSIWFPLLLATKAFFSLELMILSTTVILVFALVLFLLIGLLVRVMRLYLLRRTAFWKTALVQSAAVFILTIGSFKLTSFLFADIGRWLREIPPDAFGSNNLEATAEAIAQLLNAVLARWSELTYAIGTLFHYPYWPHNLSAGLLRELNTLHLGPLATELLLVLVPTGLLLHRYRVNVLSKTPAPNKVDKKLCDLVLRLRSAHTRSTVLFRKSFLVTTRHLEIIRMNLFSLFGHSCAWAVLGFIGGIGRVLAETHLTMYWNALVVTWAIMLVLTIFQLGTYGRLHFLISIDAEGREICLLRLGGVTLADLYDSRVRLLRIITLPASALSILIAGIGARFTVEYWLVALLAAIFICINVPKLLLLGGVAFPRFDAPHFEESGSFAEQQIVDTFSPTPLALLISLVLIPVLVFMAGLISLEALLFMVVTYFGIATIIVHYSVINMLGKLRANIKQAETVL
jgi:hypothetical protein